MIRQSFCILLGLLLLSGCGGGGGGSSSAAAPCDLIYSILFLTVEEGELLIPLTPTVGCGTVSDWSVTPILPGGLTISQVDGTISGTPTTAGTDDDYVITASNSTGSTDFTLRILINPNAPCALTYPNPLVIVEQGTAINPQTPMVSCGDVAQWSVLPALPGGLFISQVDGTISGTPTTAGTDDDYIVTASNVTGMTSFSIQIQVNPPPPCNLVYPLSFVMVAAGVALDPQIPTVSCGPVATWQATPLLPAGLQIDPIDGTISGIATTDGHDEFHLITASNAGGSTAFNLRIRIDPIFTYQTSPTTGSYSTSTGVGSVNLALTLVEDSGNPTYPTDISGFNLVLSHDELSLTVATIGPSAVMQALNGGAGPTFWFQNTQGDEVVIGSIFSFTSLAVMQFDTEKEVVLIDYDTIPAVFIGQSGAVPVDFIWVEDSPQTTTTNDLLVVTDSAQGIAPLTVDAQVSITASP
ncbi:MAG: hypothetical protein HN891_05905 [Planctomycetes bacterium]|nr:hypothetical protein [Planctomycetota bacterium]MBT6541215.1 hypothetical protein [Planctomycetota bacterium]MBT6969215.1 hypothetical protein [Planctomycetota bacterium]MBT7130227.1 hypothetical protein [Planctomycetota bacterium]